MNVLSSDGWLALADRDSQLGPFPVEEGTGLSASGCTFDSNSPTPRVDLSYVDTAVALKLHDDLLASQPTGARHDADICPFCADKAAQATASDPSGSGRPDVSSHITTSTEGGDTPTMTDISQEAHDALVKAAVAEAVKTTEAALLAKQTELAEANTKLADADSKVTELSADITRLNGELDAAQVKLTSASEEAASLKQAAADAEEAARVSEIASKRIEQVKNLKLFPDEYVTTERASKWAAQDDASWAEQVEEWKQLKPASAASGETTSDAASAMTGTSDLTKEQQDAAAASGSETPKPRRAALGLI